MSIRKNHTLLMSLPPPSKWSRRKPSFQKMKLEVPGPSFRSRFRHHLPEIRSDHLLNLREEADGTPRPPRPQRPLPKKNQDIKKNALRRNTVVQPLKLLSLQKGSRPQASTIPSGGRSVDKRKLRPRPLRWLEPIMAAAEALLQVLI